VFQCEWGIISDAVRLNSHFIHHVLAQRQSAVHACALKKRTVMDLRDVEMPSDGKEKVSTLESDFNLFAECLSEPVF
jgi:hypothetical protein